MKRLFVVLFVFLMATISVIPVAAQSSCTTPSWITPGALAQITPGTPNKVRTSPVVSQANVAFLLGHPSQSTQNPPETGVFTILENEGQLAFCPEGSEYAWIKIDYQGAVYYTAIYSLNNPNEVWVMPAPPVQQVQETPQQELVETCTEMLNLPLGGTFVSILAGSPPQQLRHNPDTDVVFNQNHNIIVAVPAGTILSLDYQAPSCADGYVWYQGYIVSSGNETVQGWFAAGRTSGELFVNKFSN